MKSLPCLVACLGLATIPCSLVARPAPMAEDLGDVMPGDVHLGILANAAEIGRDLPAVVRQGWLARKLDDWVARGWPDPRQLATQVAVGVDFDGRTPRRVTVLTQGSLRVAAAARLAARAAGVTLDERAHRGVTLLSASVPRFSLEAADLDERASLLAWDATGEHRMGRQAVDTMLGSHRSLRQVHQVCLDPDTYAAAAIQVPLLGQGQVHAMAASLEEATGIEGLRFLVQGSFAWKRTGGRLRLGSELETWTATEAALLARGIRAALERLKASIHEPRVRWVLDRLEVRQTEARVQLALDVQWQRAVAALAALAIMDFPGA